MKINLPTRRGINRTLPARIGETFTNIGHAVGDPIGEFFSQRMPGVSEIKEVVNDSIQQNLQALEGDNSFGAMKAREALYGSLAGQAFIPETIGEGTLLAAGPIVKASEVAYQGLRIGRRAGIVGLGSIAADGMPLVRIGPRLLPGEGNVGTFDDLIAAGSKGDNLTPHHIPSANRMSLGGVSRGDGIAINMEQPFGAGGRHRATFTNGTQADIGLSARDALAAGVWDARQIYRADDLYTPQIRSSLQELIQMNKTAHPPIFMKPTEP